jgi:hypothetical protein
MSMERKKEISYEYFVKNKKDPEFAEYRQICKALNLGFPGGIGFDVMHSQLSKQGINIGTTVLEEANSELFAYFGLRKYKKKYNDVRVRRTGKNTWQVIRDPLVKLKKKFFDLYPELRSFLKEEHKKFQTGKNIPAVNDWGEKEWEPAHKFITSGLARDNCTYTAVCNGYLMQSPGAQGAKNMLWKVFNNVWNTDEIYMLAFIHDEIICEVRDNENLRDNVDLLCNLMIDAMKEILKGVRITVEASWMDYWDKAGGKEEILRWK